MGKKRAGVERSTAYPALGAAFWRLDNWFERQKRVLPWRDEPTLYRVWVSEIMLQQTQVATVVPYFERFMKRFPTVERLARAPLDEVLLQWAGLGYYSRARNLHLAAQKIARDGFPVDRDRWLEVPGVGDYTAGAILSIALDQPEAILDGNVERVLSRIRRVSRGHGDAEYKLRLWRLSRLFVTRAHGEGIRPSALNQALMELGATICTPKKPGCLLCPLAEICRSRQFGDVEAFPPKKKGKKWIDVREEVHCIFDSRGRMLLGKREAGRWRAGLWDFPEAGPRHGDPVWVGRVESRHVVTRHKVTRLAHVWRISAPRALIGAAEAPRPRAGKRGALPEFRWISATSPEVAVGSALKKTLQKIRDAYPEVLPERSSLEAASSPRD